MSPKREKMRRLNNACGCWFCNGKPAEHSAAEQRHLDRTDDELAWLWDDADDLELMYNPARE
jgi:hypothetical protein